MLANIEHANISWLVHSVFTTQQAVWAVTIDYWIVIVCLEQFTSRKDAPPTHFSAIVSINLVWILVLFAPQWSFLTKEFWSQAS